MKGYRKFIFIFLAQILIFFEDAQSYKCSTPEDWLKTAKQSKQYLLNGIGGKWPNGLVKYRIASSLPERDRQEIQKAFREYHKKTCIRFVEYSDSDENYVSIELDNNVCGMAHICMKGGPQLLKFGQNCRNRNNLVHQLGHTLCLLHADYHQHEDKYIKYSEECLSSGLKNESSLNSRIYDSASQMHVDCDTATSSKCDYQITNGLSLQDADYINALYNCQGCHRHRWISKESSDLIDNDALFSFGFAGLHGLDVYPCRANFKGKLSVGIYNKKEGTCYIGDSGKEYKLCEQFEVLTIPGGVRKGNTEYVLEEAYNGMSIEKERSLFKNAVPAGRLPWADGASSYGQGYVAFGNVVNFQKSCKYETMWWSGGANRKVDVIGTAWRLKNGTHAFATLCQLEFPVNIYYVLSCKGKKESLSSKSTDTHIPSATLPEIIPQNSLQNITVTVIESQCLTDRKSLSSSSQQQKGKDQYTNLMWVLFIISLLACCGHQ